MLGWRPPYSQLSNALSIVELMVDMDCKGCEKKVRRAISKIDGVDTVEIDVEQQKVTVTGYVDRMKVLKMVRRTGRTTEFWPFPYDGVFDHTALFNSSINASLVDDKTLYLFSDDNVHACAVM